MNFEKITDSPRGTIYDILCYAYSYDDRIQEVLGNDLEEGLKILEKTRKRIE